MQEQASKLGLHPPAHCSSASGFKKELGSGLWQALYHGKLLRFMLRQRAAYGNLSLRFHGTGTGLAPPVRSSGACQLDHDCPVATAKQPNCYFWECALCLQHLVLACPSSLARSVPALGAGSELRRSPNALNPHKVQGPRSQPSAPGTLHFPQWFVKNIGRFLPACLVPAGIRMSEAEHMSSVF